MIRANIEAEIDAKKAERNLIYKELQKIDNMIDDLKEQKYKMLEEDSELYYEIGELENLRYEMQNNY